MTEDRMDGVDRTGAVPDTELEALGSALREQGRTRSGDLDDLLQRSHRRDRRTRLTIGSVVLALVVGLSALALTRSAGESQLQTAGQPGGTSASAATTPSSAAPRPTWTVNNSIPMKGQENIWALEVLYDPAVWSFSRFEKQPSLRSVPGMAGFHSEPRLDAYWSGPGAQEAALAAQTELRGQPGILSTEVAPASAEHNSPGTSAGLPGR